MTKRGFKIGVLLFISVVTARFVDAQQTAQVFVQETQYLLFLPEGYESDTVRQWPLMIFLHGSGESGVDLEKVKTHGPPELIEAGKKFPFIVVSPQAPPRTGWRADVMKPMLEYLKKKYRVDEDRIYLTGLSMGGFGTWDMAEKYPNDFAAIAPICGGGDVEKAWALRHMPIWCFHGAKDETVPLASSQKIVDAVSVLNKDVKFTIYPEAGHNSWEVTYNNDSLYTWLLSKKKFRYKAITETEASLRKYAGTYLNAGGDTVRIHLEDGNLVASPGRGAIELIPYAEGNFFWNENSIDEVRFTRNRKGEVDAMTVYGNDKGEFKKIGLKK